MPSPGLLTLSTSTAKASPFQKIVNHLNIHIEMLCSSFTVDSPNVSVADGFITSNYTYQTTRVAVTADGNARVTPVEQRFIFKTQTKVPKLGMMLVGWGGNNGSTVTAGILANIHKMSWPTREGTRSSLFSNTCLPSTYSPQPRQLLWVASAVQHCQSRPCRWEGRLCPHVFSPSDGTPKP